MTGGFGGFQANDYHNNSSIGSEVDGQDLYMKSTTGLFKQSRNQG